MAASSVVVVFLTSDYISSANCRRELVAAMEHEVPLIVVLESEKEKGATTRTMLHMELDRMHGSLTTPEMNAIFRLWQHFTVGGDDAPHMVGVVDWHRESHLKKEALLAIAWAGYTAMAAATPGFLTARNTSSETGRESRRYGDSSLDMSSCLDMSVLPPRMRTRGDFIEESRNLAVQSRRKKALPQKNAGAAPLKSISSAVSEAAAPPQDEDSLEESSFRGGDSSYRSMEGYYSKKIPVYLSPHYRNVPMPRSTFDVDVRRLPHGSCARPLRDPRAKSALVCTHAGPKAARGTATEPARSAASQVKPLRHEYWP